MMKTVVRWAPVMLDSSREEYVSTLLMAETEEDARENGRNARAHYWTGRLARIEWQTPREDFPQLKVVNGG